MEHFLNLVLAALLSLAAVGSTALCVSAQTQTNTPGENAGTAAFDQGQLVPAAPVVAVPAGVRATLPRGAKTLFCVRAQLENRAVLLHGWSPGTDRTNLDILAATPTPSSTKRTKRRTRSRSAAYSRLNRIAVGLMEPRNIVVRAAPLKAGSRGSVITLEWSESQSAGAFSTVPMNAVVLPAGLSGRAIQQDLSTESSSSGNVFHLMHVGRDGRAFMRLTTQSFDAGTQTLQRFAWNGRKFEVQGEEITVPLPND